MSVTRDAIMDFYSTNPGPIDDSILYDQDKHVSAAIWDGQERGALRCHEHTSKLDRWTLTDKQVDLVRKAGFGYLRLIPSISLDNPLISSLVERWRRETNTFHLTVGEMTVTLEDVAYLIGLPINGEPVIGVTHTSCDAVCVKYLGRAPDPGYTSGGMVKLSWLKQTFLHCPEDASIEEVRCCTRAYLLYLVGSTIFSTTTGNKVPVMYLPLFEDFDEAGKYAWGAAALSFLYRALGNACLKSQSTISGCLTLLQCWSYYHLNVGRPRLHHDPIHECFPFVLRWKGKQSGPNSNRDVAFYRKALDYLKPSDVDWCPYVNISRTVIPDSTLSNLFLGRAKTMLICFDKAERHLPDRCLRQFGMSQTIPDDVQRWERKTRGVDGGVDLSTKMESELSEWANRRFHIVEAEEEDVKEMEYMQWYMNITRKLVGRPIPISSEFQRMSATLRDIAHLADIISTHGMDDQQIQSLARIRYMAHDVFRDQFRSSLAVPDSQTDDGEKVRGKKRVRRRATGKRKKRDIPEHCFVLPTVHPRLYAVEQTRYRVDDEMDGRRLCIAPNGSDYAGFPNFAQKVEEEQLHCANNEVDESIFQQQQAGEEVDDDDDVLSQGGSEGTAPGSLIATEETPSLLESSEDVAQQSDYGVVV